MMPMNIFAFGLLAASALLGFAAVPAVADTIFEVEHARGNARAGGPVSEDDAELLARWGALSGTPGWSNSFRRPYASEDDAIRHQRRNEHHRLYRD
jgi:hypothetical protein